MFQESHDAAAYSRERAIAALKKMTAPRAKVWRDGRLVILPAVEIVPGDIIEFEAGDLVPADARLLEAASLKSIEAALTGESDAVSKRADTLDRINELVSNPPSLKPSPARFFSQQDAKLSTS